MKGIFFGNCNDVVFNKVYSQEIQSRLKKIIDFYPDIIHYNDLEERAGHLKDVDFIFSTWGMPALTHDEIDTYFPSLKVVFYGAGTVQGFARPFLEKNIKVVSAWGANAVPVAEFTVAQIILANKGYFQAVNIYKSTGVKSSGKYCNTFPGNYGIKVGIIGAGQIGTLVIKMLKAYKLEVLVYDPFLSDQKADELGVLKVGLKQIFRECQTISNHLANNNETRNLLNYDLFKLMKNNATFINTGRGAQVVEEDLIRALKEEKGRTALLDVRNFVVDNSNQELERMPNIILTPHIAGSMNAECQRMGNYMYDELLLYLEGRPLKYEVTLEMLKTMA